MLVNSNEEHFKTKTLADIVVCLAKGEQPSTLQDLYQTSVNLLLKYVLIDFENHISEKDETYLQTFTAKYGTVEGEDAKRDRDEFEVANQLLPKLVGTHPKKLPNNTMSNLKSVIVQISSALSSSPVT